MDHECFYCKSTENLSWDHIIPCSWFSFEGRKSADKYPKVRACQECNCFLSNFALYSLEERLEYLYNRYKGRNINLIKNRLTIKMDAIKTRLKYLQSTIESRYA